MDAKAVTPILNVSDIVESFAWFEKLGWKKGLTGATLRRSGPSAPANARSSSARVRKAAAGRAACRRPRATASRATRASGCRSGWTTPTGRGRGLAAGRCEVGSMPSPSLVPGSGVASPRGSDLAVCPGHGNAALSDVCSGEPGEVPDDEVDAHLGNSARVTAERDAASFWTSSDRPGPVPRPPTSPPPSPPCCPDPTRKGMIRVIPGRRPRGRARPTGRT